jgi:hypothetical protein
MRVLRGRLADVVSQDAQAHTVHVSLPQGMAFRFVIATRLQARTWARAGLAMRGAEMKVIPARRLAPSRNALAIDATALHVLRVRDNGTASVE